MFEAPSHGLPDTETRQLVYYSMSNLQGAHPTTSNGRRWFEDRFQDRQNSGLPCSNSWQGKGNTFKLQLVNYRSLLQGGDRLMI